MKDHSKLFSIFKSFIFEIRTQFGITICTIHRSNAYEYFLHLSIPLCPSKVLSTKHVLTLHNKMELLKEKTIIWLK